MHLSIVVACSNDRVIGRDNRLLWHLPSDLKRFKSLTMGHPMIMGRKTFESIGKPLPGRTSIVVTHNTHYQRQGCLVAHSVEEAVTA
ncbi:MAG: dihydrofolate reductase, partial [Ferruginibacter sp.]|nr:dihydrofolate reductase [Cytophagales bacterium]